MFRTVLRVNSDIFLQQHEPVDRCIGGVSCEERTELLCILQKKFAELIERRTFK
jgi:hypothetical protein